MTNATSASMRGWMNRSGAITAPSSKAMSSSSTPESGTVMFSAACMALEVRPIFQPMMRRPDASLRFTQASWMA